MTPAQPPDFHLQSATQRPIPPPQMRPLEKMLNLEDWPTSKTEKIAENPILRPAPPPNSYSGVGQSGAGHHFGLGAIESVWPTWGCSKIFQAERPIHGGGWTIWGGEEKYCSLEAAQG